MATLLIIFNAQKEEGKNVDLGTNEGVYVDKVNEDGNGAEIGLQSKDVITKFDGKKERRWLNCSNFSTANVLATRLQ